MENQPSTGTDPTIALLERWRGGDRAALDALLAELIPWLHAEARRVMGKGDVGIYDSMDLTQTTALKVLSEGPKFVPHSGAQLRALLKRIVTNEIIDERRRAVRSGGHLESMAPGSPSMSGFGPAASSGSRPSRDAAKQEEAGWVRLALQLLEADEREMLLASEVYGKDWATIAREAELANADAARMRVARLKPKLANLIRKLRRGDFPLE